VLPNELKPILESLCRVGLGADNPAFRRQVERLAETLRDSGHKTEAASIQRLLTAAKKTATMQPSKVGVAQAFAGTEVMSDHMSIPADKESGVPLAEVRFPASPACAYPILEDGVQSAVLAIAQEWKHGDRLHRFGVMPAQTCLLYGLPGTGKTQTAYAIADELELPVVLARLDGLVSSFLGTTARNIANLFQFANRYRCILLLDEFDAIAKLRDDPHEVGEIKRVVNSILQNLDLRKGRGITLAITNHDQLLDPAVWRRFEARILIPPPSLAARRVVARKFFAPVPFDETAEALVAWATEGMTGADIEMLARGVKRHLALVSDSSLLDALRHCVVTNSSGGSYPHFTTLLQPNLQLARTLSAQVDLHLTQRDLARLFQSSQAQVSRWVRQEPSTHEANA